MVKAGVFLMALMLPILGGTEVRRSLSVLLEALHYSWAAGLIAADRS